MALSTRTALSCHQNISSHPRAISSDFPGSDEQWRKGRGGGSRAGSLMSLYQFENAFWPSTQAAASTQRRTSVAQHSTATSRVSFPELSETGFGAPRAQARPATSQPARATWEHQVVATSRGAVSGGGFGRGGGGGAGGAPAGIPEVPGSLLATGVLTLCMLRLTCVFVFALASACALCACLRQSQCHIAIESARSYLHPSTLLATLRTHAQCDKWRERQDSSSNTA